MSDRQVVLEAIGTREALQGILTRLRLSGRNGYADNIVHLTRDELQAIVNAAAAQYDIVAECTCRDEDWSPTCPVHHAR